MHSENSGDNELFQTFIQIETEIDKVIDQDIRKMLKESDLSLLDAYKALSFGFMALSAVVAKNMNVTEETVDKIKIDYEVLGIPAKEVYRLLCCCTELIRPIREGLKND